MNNAVVVDQILRPHAGQIQASTEQVQTFKIGSVRLSLGDSKWQLADPLRYLSATGGLLPHARVYFVEDTPGATSLAAFPLFNAAIGLGSFATLASSDSFLPQQDLPFRLYAACSSEPLATRINLQQNPVIPAPPHLAVADMPVAAVRLLTHELTPATGMVRDVAGLLHGWPQSRLARLFGVSRQTWRDWLSGTTAPRPTRRSGVIEFAHALKRRAEAEGGNLGGWLESPLWTDRPDTPESLARGGNRSLVAALAFQRPSRHVTTRLTDFAPLDVGDDLLDASRIYASSPDDE